MIRQATLMDMAWVSHNLRESDYLAISAYQWHDNMDAWATERYAKSACWSLIGEGTPVAVGGITDQRPGVGYAWLVATPAWGKHWREAARAVRLAVHGFMSQPSVHRLEAGCMCSCTEAERFLRWLGFSFEGTQRKAGKRGEDVSLWAIVKELA